MLISLYHAAADLPQWAWGAMGVGAVIAIVWFLIDFVSFLVVSAFMFVLGFVGVVFGWDLIARLF